MPYAAPLAEYRFLLDHVLGFARVAATPRFAEATADTVAAVLAEAAKLCETDLAPLQRAGDRQPARLENGIVRTSPGFAEGYRALAEGGFMAIAADPAHGGLGLPMTVTSAVNEMIGSACMALQLNPLMTQGQIEALEHHASDALKALYIPRLVSGEWCGTMNLTEPQAGSDVGALALAFSLANNLEAALLLLLLGAALPGIWRSTVFWRTIAAAADSERGEPGWQLDLVSVAGWANVVALSSHASKTTP